MALLGAIVPGLEFALQLRDAPGLSLLGIAPETQTQFVPSINAFGHLGANTAWQLINVDGSGKSLPFVSVAELSESLIGLDATAQAFRLDFAAPGSLRASNALELRFGPIAHAQDRFSTYVVDAPPYTAEAGFLTILGGPFKSGDFDGDGDEDVVWSSVSPSYFEALPGGLQEGTANPILGQTTGAAGSLAVGDFDGDGRDSALAYYGNS